MLEVFLGLAGKADNDIRRDTNAGFGGAELGDDAEKFFARVAAVHQLEQPVAAALQRNVRALAQLRQARVSFHQIVAITFRMRRGEADAFQSINRVNGIEQLDKSGFAIKQRIIALAEARDNLAEQSDFPHTARDEFAAFGDDIVNRATAFFAARAGHDAEGAVLIAALHDADERADGSFRAAIEQMFADGRFAFFFGSHVHNMGRLSFIDGSP